MILIDLVILFCNFYGFRFIIVRYFVLLCLFKLYFFFNMSMYKLIELIIFFVLRCLLKYFFLFLVRIIISFYVY